MILTNLLQDITAGYRLNELDAYQMINTMLNTTNTEQVAACLSLLNFQQDNIALLTGVVQALQAVMQKINTSFPIMDIVGTGGDLANTVNISTGSALLLASCNVKVAKHGNRAVSSACGSAEVLTALGIPIENTAISVAKSIADYNFGFCYAPLFHPSFQILRPIRKALGIPTIFNLIGPLLNPAQAEYLMIGVYKPHLLKIFAELLTMLPIKRALVFHSCGLDELTTAAPATAYLVENSTCSQLTLNAEDYGLKSYPLTALQGGTPEFNANLLYQALSGHHAAIAETLIFNAGVGLYLYGHVNSITKGIILAKEYLYNGSTLTLLTRLQTVGN
ncbi:MAG: anthranilate phosphoribosyltransferase [Gammaproteobacteria bacterium RIFCSPHIGHO2_12_FULL_35_23]|nr:MAG: anthranilate phosphoribosyltransferase [Gammaproteobacteria bacterium RIFCSPHIGHO2_12_FULL_35_23]